MSKNTSLKETPVKLTSLSSDNEKKVPSTNQFSFSDWEYSPAPQNQFFPLKKKYDLFIGGKFVPAAQERYFESINPANEQVLAQVAYGAEEDVDRAVKAARKAYDGVWSKIGPKERAKYLFKVDRIIQERSRELAIVETLDGGKPIKESRDIDIPLVAGHFFYHAGWADKLEYAFNGLPHSPHGVAGQIIPWNFPLLMAAWKIAPALACGNTVVIKPAETTSLSIYHLAEIFQQAGLPEGVVNIVSGYGDTGAAIVNHPGTDKLAFTGSTDVGKLIQRSIAKGGKQKPLTLELGGKGAHIIFDDAPMYQAVEGIINGIYFNQGHVCCAGSRLLVHESVHDEVVDKLLHRIRTLRLGDPLDKNTDIGAINSKEQLERIQELAESGQLEGATVYDGGQNLPEKGFFFRPTFFTGVSQSHRIARDEIFGPVLSIMTFRTLEEAAAKANNTAYGLSAGIWTAKGSRILEMGAHMRAGVVWANTFNKFDPTSPFGGFKESGFGREGGIHGLSAYVKLGL